MAETGYDSRIQREGTLAVIGDMGMYLFCSMVADIWLATGSRELLPGGFNQCNIRHNHQSRGVVIPLVSFSMSRGQASDPLRCTQDRNILPIAGCVPTL